MRALITGAGGQLGRAITRGWRDDELIAPGASDLDVTDEPSVWAAVRDYQPQVVVNCAAYTAVDACETDPEPAWAVNAGGAANLARACSAAGIGLVHLSTDYVFDGTLDRPYTEFDRPNPVSVYGRTKDAGEQLVRERCDEHVIVRTSWLQGIDGANFTKTMLRLGRERDRVEVVTDQVGTPTFAFDLAEAIRQLTVTRRYGTFHVTNAGACTWFDYAEAIFEEAGLDVEVAPTTAAAFGAPAPRPANSRLEGRHAAMAGLGALPHWRDGLRRLVRALEAEAA
ncbi:dTDP-4-dehydrorhamnose reductase [Egibacter rhizosphaerae]|uniref:dTDP-4-dehydrorhamnose reductase n=1 Tax=Egibacter rhizosphaerae TaxID=1670831 RepID=A0A411YGD4_9ACTN|nr:dTDP-4-dehydrorhamnose reductase [Egibacter rhizosphaerae]QBI20300.1 dTDP-4-dehydrorhamnose reductase [Egibacter rhizosphaerae]